MRKSLVGSSGAEKIDVRGWVFFAAVLLVGFGIAAGWIFPNKTVQVGIAIAGML